MKMSFLQRMEVNVVGRLLRASDARVSRMTAKRWTVDGVPLDRRAQFMFTVGRFAERSMPRMTARKARRYYARLCRVLEAPPPDIGRTAELTIATRSGPRPARAYYPSSAAESDTELSALVYFHGGGFTIGGLDTHDTLCRRICARAGCVVISVDYRLAPEAAFPAAIEDCMDGYRWVFEHAIDLGIDSSKLAVGGDSAGGNLAAVVCSLARDESRPMPCAQLLIYPGVGTPDHVGRKHPELQTGYGLDAETLRWFSANYVPQNAKDDPRVAPLHMKSHAGLPPTVIVTAQFDLLCAEGLEYASKLRAAGVPVTHLHVPDLPHGFATMSVLPRAREAIIDFATALRGYLETT